ncbi:2-phospho-L-lactate guanylyltransferase [Nocardioides pyridinolyticus]
MTSSWQVLVPVKHLSVAKTRMALPPADRATLVVSMLRDTVRSALGAAGVEAVHVVSGDPLVADVAHREGAESLLVDGTMGLNAELVVAARQLPSGATDGVAVVLADLPCLTSAVLSRVLAAAAPGVQGYVEDLHGTGTTILLAPGGVPLRPAFEGGSAARHARLGRVIGPVEGLARARRDVDTLGDLGQAAALGLGACTRACWGSLAAAGAPAAGVSRAVTRS